MVAADCSDFLLAETMTALTMTATVVFVAALVVEATTNSYSSKFPFTKVLVFNVIPSSKKIPVKEIGNVKLLANWESRVKFPRNLFDCQWIYGQVILNSGIALH
jgi:hypothetical protein